MSSAKVTPALGNNILALMALILDEENSDSDLDSPIPPESSKIEPGTEPSDVEEIDDYKQLLMKEGLRKKRSSSKATGAPSAKRRSSIFLGAADIAADGLRDLSSGIVSAMSAPQTTKFDQCLPLLNKLRDDEDLEDHDYFHFCDFLMGNQTYTSMFYGMAKDLRLKWLKAKCPDSAENGNSKMY